MIKYVYHPMNQIEITLNSGVLECPVCGCGNIHQSEVLNAVRDGEDSNGTVCISGQKGVSIERVEDEFITGRRDVIYITFQCETDCSLGSNEGYRLRIMQHKGDTLISWVRADDVLKTDDINDFFDPPWGRGVDII